MKKRLVRRGYRVTPRERPASRNHKAPAISPAGAFLLRFISEQGRSLSSRQEIPVHLQLPDLLVQPGLCFLLPCDISHSFPTATAALSLGAGLSLSYLSEFRGPPQTILIAGLSIAIHGGVGYLLQLRVKPSPALTNFAQRLSVARYRIAATLPLFRHGRTAGNSALLAGTFLVLYQ